VARVLDAQAGASKHQRRNPVRALARLLMPPPVRGAFLACFRRVYRCETAPRMVARGADAQAGASKHQRPRRCAARSSRAFAGASIVARQRRGWSRAALMRTPALPNISAEIQCAHPCAPAQAAAGARRFPRVLSACPSLRDSAADGRARR